MLPPLWSAEKNPPLDDFVGRGACFFVSDVLSSKCFGATRAEEQETGRTAAPGDKPPHPGGTGPSLVSAGPAQCTCRRPGPGGEGNPGRLLSAPGSQCLEPGLRSPVGPQRPLPPGPSTKTRPQGRRAGRPWGTTCLPGSRQAGLGGPPGKGTSCQECEKGRVRETTQGPARRGCWAPAIRTPRRARWPGSKQPLRVALAVSQPSQLHPPRGTWGSTADPLLQRGSSRLGRPGPGTWPVLLSQGERSQLGC